MTPVRIQLFRSKGYRLPANTLKVDRTTKWGNPFRIGANRFNGVVWEAIPDAETAVRFFCEMLEQPRRNYPTCAEIDSQLRGKNLACWCRLDAPCHADVLLHLANGDKG